MLGHIHKVLFATTALVPIACTSIAVANPQGAQVVGGNVTVQGQGTPGVTVTQSTDKAIINWKTFNIAPGEKTQFVQPSSSSIVLNRVTGGLGPSEVYGSLSANGRLFVVNPDGILIGSGARIDAAGFLATTHDIANSDFMVGRYNFFVPGRPNASIVNQGTITAQSSGFAALVAPGVRNTGTISARLGNITLASGNRFSLDFYGDKLVTLGVNDAVAATVKDVATGESLKSLVSNSGKLRANGGTVELTAVAARRIVDSVINNSGVIEANSIGSHNGMIVLGGATGASKPASTPTQVVSVSGRLSAAGKSTGTSGGKIQITGENIQLTNATLDVSGRSGGGKVLVGGDTGGGHPNSAIASNTKAAPEAYVVPTATTVAINAATKIDASAKADGDGGKVVVWANDATIFAGSVAARGGETGDGGFVEVSGKHALSFTGAFDGLARNGKNGALFLDPQDVTIGSTGAWIVTPAAIQTALATGDVIVVTGSGAGNGDITVNQPVSWNSPNSLILSAYRNIFVNSNLTSTGAGSVTLRADNTGVGTGTVGFGVGAAISTAGAVSIFYNPSVNSAGSGVNNTSYMSPVERYASNTTGGAVLTAYMLVNSVFDLQNIQNNLAGNYALGRNIDASATATWNGGDGFIPIGRDCKCGSNPTVFTSLTGIFDGQQHTIDNLTINPSVAGFDGLFVSVFASGVVRNVGLTNLSLSSGGYAGGIAGGNSGMISHVSVSGQVGCSSCGNGRGGVVGVNNSGGLIEDSYSSATVSGSAGNGGLVSENDGMISRSYATGSVSGLGSVGGLVSRSSGTIVDSYASGAVTAAIGSGGGFVDVNGGPINTSYSAGLSGGSISGFIHFNSGTVTNGYWDSQTNSASSAAGTGLTTVQLKSGLPAGFDPTVWAIGGGINNGYPYLKWQTAIPSQATTLTASAGPIATLPPGTPPTDTGQTKLFNVAVELKPKNTLEFFAINTTTAGSTPAVPLQNAIPPETRAFANSILESAGFNYASMPALSDLLAMLFLKVPLDAVVTNKAWEAAVVKGLKDEFANHNISIADIKGIPAGVLGGIIVDAVADAWTQFASSRAYSPYAVEVVRYGIEAAGNGVIASLQTKNAALGFSIGLVSATAGEVAEVVKAGAGLYLDRQAATADIVKINSVIANLNSVATKVQKSGDKNAYDKIMRAIQSEASARDALQNWLDHPF